MNKSKSSLTDILSELITKRQKSHHPLKRGLTLAYTPCHLNKTDSSIYRLTLSRNGRYPSEQEIEVVKRDLYTALNKNGRFPDNIHVEPYLKTKRNIYYHVLFWKEFIQKELDL